MFGSHFLYNILHTLHSGKPSGNIAMKTLDLGGKENAFGVSGMFMKSFLCGDTHDIYFPDWGAEPRMISFSDFLELKIAIKK